MLIKLVSSINFSLKLQNFNWTILTVLVINMNGKKCRVGGGGGCCICYIILGGWSPEMLLQCYIGWGGGQKFPILRYIICARPLSGDIHLNPGPPSQFNICTLNICSLANQLHYTALADLALTRHIINSNWIKIKPSFSGAPRHDAIINSRPQPDRSLRR